MRILLTNVQLNARTGTEIVVRDIEAALRRRGHEVCVYTPAPGEVADEIVAAGGTVVSDLADATFEPEIIHGHHHVATSEALVRFPLAAAVFVCHDRTSANDIPVLSPRIGRYVSVDRNCDERLAIEAGILEERRRIVGNGVDLGRIHRRPPLPAHPRRAAVLSNNATPGGYTEAIRTACAARGISLEVFGSGVGATLVAPEEVLGSYDIVFAKARSALEALALGCAVVLVDAGGLGQLVTMTEVADMRDWNFGARCLQRPVAAELLGAEIDRYDPSDAAAVTDWIRDVADLEKVLDRYLDVYSEVMGEPRQPEQTTWSGLQASLLAYSGGLERLVRHAEGPALIRSVPPTVGPAVMARFVRPPAQVNSDRLVTIDVEVRNGSNEVLATRGGHPIHLSYRWAYADGGQVAGEPERTLIESPIAPRSSHRQAVTVRTPAAEGTFHLRPDLVQEGMFWFGELPGFEPQRWPVSVTAADLGGAWTLGRLADLVPLDVVRDGTFDALGFAASAISGMLTFGESERFVDRAVRNPGTACVIVPPGLVGRVPSSLSVAVSEEPRVTFVRIHDLLATRTDFYGTDIATWIHPSADVHPTAHVDLQNVAVGPGATVGPHATLSGRVRVGDGASVGAGAIVGSAGFQTVEVDGAPVEMVHAGGVEIGSGAVVFANAAIARGLFRTDTVVGEGARVGNGAFVSHNTTIGARSFVGHGAVVNGNVTIGSDSWIGPGATITNDVSLGDGCRVSLGATVFGDVAPGEHLTGPAAVDHRIALRASAELRRRR